MSKTFICKGCKEKYDINMQSSNTGYCYICNEFYMKQQLANSEAQNKRVLEKLELIVRSNQELEKTLELACDYICGIRSNLPFYAQENMKVDEKYFINYFKEQAQEEIKNASICD